MKNRTYIAIDLKSFYASVECMERGLDPLTTNLVVADASRTEKTICLAVSPSLKAYGISGRARLFEVVQRVKEVNAARLCKAPGRVFSGASFDDIELKCSPSLSLDYIAAPPRMAHYIDYSTRIYNVYLKYIAPEDIHVYSIDEVFIDATNYLSSYKLSARELTTMETIRTVFIQTIEKPARKVIIKRGVKATAYFAYCEEVGCDVWGLLTSIKSISGEPVCLWLPAAYIAPGTSEYVQGVEVPLTYDGIIPDGFDLIELSAAKYLMFKGESFAEEDYCQAIETLQEAIEKYDPSVINAQWDKTNPRIQLEPIGTRGYIELLPIK